MLTVLVNLLHRQASTGRKTSATTFALRSCQPSMPEAFTSKERRAANNLGTLASGRANAVICARVEQKIPLTKITYDVAHESPQVSWMLPGFSHAE